MIEKKDCFAWSKDKCIALDLKECEDCSFYKTVEQEKAIKKRLYGIE